MTDYENRFVTHCSSSQNSNGSQQQTRPTPVGTRPTNHPIPSKPSQIGMVSTRGDDTLWQNSFGNDRGNKNHG